VKITTNIRYGVRALCDIAYHSTGSPVHVREISERQGISPRYIEQIFLKLGKRGVVKSLRGPAGGYLLARRPEEITVGDVIRAIEGESIQLVNCKSRRGSRNACERLKKCVVSDIWAEGSRVLTNYFDSITLDQICEDARERGVEI
jgi:Rrf2 family transcriptional regulator, iron-sulfur cluster assembly transcription factor